MKILKAKVEDKMLEITGISVEDYEISLMTFSQMNDKEFATLFHAWS